MSSEKNTRQNRVREALGRIYEQQPPYFREYLRRYQEDPTSRVFAPLAEAYRKMGRIEEAIAICKDGLEHHPDFYGGRVALAKCYLDRKLYAAALPELDRVVRAVPENLLAQRLLGDTHLALGDRASALHCFKMALLMAPNDVALSEKVHQLEKTVQFRPELPRKEEVFTEPKFTTPSRAALSESQDPEMAPFWSLEPTNAPQVPMEPAKPEEPKDVASELSVMDEEEDTRFNPNTESINALLGYKEEDDVESFQVQGIGAIFESPEDSSKEITTETLGDLYMSQGQHDQALRIFEKLYSVRPLPELLRKMNLCRSHLGVSKEVVVRNRQVEMLQNLLRRAQQPEISS